MKNSNHWSSLQKQTNLKHRLGLATELEYNIKFHQESHPLIATQTKVCFSISKTRDISNFIPSSHANN